jgi:hypothetical protein
MALSDKQIKELLGEVAEDIRYRAGHKIKDADAADVLLNLAAVVEHMEPQHLRTRKER